MTTSRKGVVGIGRIVEIRGRIPFLDTQPPRPRSLALQTLQLRATLIGYISASQGATMTAIGGVPPARRVLRSAMYRGEEDEMPRERLQEETLYCAV
jgi:hypothetical protein